MKRLLTMVAVGTSVTGTLVIIWALFVTTTPEAQGNESQIEIVLDAAMGQSISLVYGDTTGLIHHELHPLYFGSYTGGRPAETIQARTYISFPLPILPSDATVISASLQLFVNDESTSGASDMAVYVVEQTWTETMTWTMQPAVDDLPVSITTVVSVSDWYSWDISALVQDWYAGSRVNFGLMLSGSPTPDTVMNRAVQANGRTASSLTPRLVIAYQQPTSTPTVTNTLTPTPIDTPTSATTTIPTLTPTATNTLPPPTNTSHPPAPDTPIPVSTSIPSQLTPTLNTPEATPAFLPAGGRESRVDILSVIVLVSAVLMLVGAGAHWLTQSQQ